MPDPMSDPMPALMSDPTAAGETAVFDLIVIVRVPDPADAGPVADALRRMRPLCLAEDGCVSWEAYRSDADPLRFVLVERWASRAHWEAHGEGAAIRQVYLPEILPRVEREVHPSTPLSSAPLESPTTGESPAMNTRHTRPRIAVVGGRPAPVHGARELGIDVTLVHTEGQFDRAEAEAHCVSVLTCDITDTAALLELLRPLHEAQPFDRILTTTELSAVPVGEVNEKLGLPGTPPEVSRIIQDKALTRQALDRHGLSPVRHRRVHSAAEAVAFLEEVGDRIVLKPGQGAGSLHINVVSDAEGAARAVREIEEFGYGGVLAEEYLEGPVVSVEAFSHEGRHVVLGVSEYRVNEHFVEWECSVPSDAAQPDLAELHRVTAGVLDAVGLTDGPSHSEFVLTPAGPRLLETHNRLSGAGIPEMVHRATGWDPARLFMTVPLGIDRLPETAPEPKRGAAIRFLDAAPGRITAITGADELPVPVRRVPAGERAPHMIPYLKDFAADDAGAVIGKHVGDEVSAMDSLLSSDRGYVFATAPTRAEAVRRCEALADGITFHVAPA
ncbi:antibiotic biosynthesis monooxygenase [Streptomyces sp. NRRL F-5727]|uniref:antibiotic biosynthesis monooxygenase n=1 Tax=Streptomyces sp. NRRL F-5727 TaxID=1463871 RepID=UPI000A782792|nr:antibiotic biosynthesis monooxygenase [Streptomyces sp. NRRL F-5727]